MQSQIKTKLAIIESTAKMGGVEFSTLYLASHLDPNAWDVTVICPEEGDLPTLCREAGVKVEIVPMNKLFTTSVRLGRSDTRIPNPFALLANPFVILAAADRLKRHMDANPYDRILSKGLYAHICGGLAAKIKKVNCTWHIQDFISERYWGLYRFAFGWLARLLADHIIADGTPIAQQLPAKIQDRVSVVFNGVDLDVFSPELDGSEIRREFNLLPDAIVIGNAARLTPWKGQHHLITAFSKIAEKYPQTRLLLVGSPTFDNDHYQQQLHTLVKNLGLEATVRFAGFRSDLPQIFAAVDIFAYTSVEKDTSPLSLISAMSCGLPIVSFDIQGVREVIGENGLLVPVEDVEKLATELGRLIENQSLRRHYAKLARESAVKNFSLQRYTDNIESVLRS